MMNGLLLHVSFNQTSSDRSIILGVVICVAAVVLPSGLFQMTSKSLSDFQKVTGLKDVYAKHCFETYGGYDGALASFAQSFRNIPKGYFDSSDAANKNLVAINAELKIVYEKARKQKKNLAGKSDIDIWKAVGASAAPSPPPAPVAVTPAALLFGQPTKGEAPKSFTFGAAAPQSAQGFSTAPPQGVTFGFGTTFSSSNAPLLPATNVKSQEPTSSESPTDGPADPPKKQVHVFCEPEHDVGPFLDMPGFWEEEVEAGASLFNLDGGFLVRSRDTLRPMMEKWVGKAQFFRQPVRYVKMEDPDEETVRVIIKDADRSFLQPRHRGKLVSFLHAMMVEFGAYGQAMSYLAGLCMLVLTENETASVLRFVAKEYIKGHWAAEAVGFSTSAWVVEHFMQKLFPDVAKHLEELKFWPDTYLQKILTGLCIHVLAFNELFQFLDAFMEGGFEYLIRFCLAVVEHFRSQLLKIRSTMEANSLYEIMSLNSRVCHVSDVQAILSRAPLIDLGEDASQLAVIRSAVYEKKVAPRLQRAPKVDTFEPCEVCDKNRPTWFSEDLGAVCEGCKSKHPELVFEKY
eukprot:gene6655-4771_t